MSSTSWLETTKKSITSSTSWLEITKTIFLGVLLYSIANVLYAIIGPINSLASFGSSIANAVGRGGGSIGGIAAFFNILTYLLLIGIVGGYVLFVLGLTNFSKILEAPDGKSVESVRNGAIVMLAGAIIKVLIWSLLGSIVYIVGFILMTLGYSNLKNSQTFPQEARNGASKLFTAMLLSLAGAILGFIPLAGGFINAVLSIIAFFLILSGWATIKNTKA
ncbi:MAG: hypothetical protein LBP63_00195 [Prevotellaceae bacterium]|jgi:hypothetical protein|nr:hypothetical protein [Prevotellaceae bacterium]